MKFKSTNDFVNYLFENQECIKTDLGSLWCPEDESKGFTDAFLKDKQKIDKDNQRYILQDEETMQALHHSSLSQLEKVLELIEPESRLKDPVEFRNEDKDTNILLQYPGSSFMPEYVKKLIYRRKISPLESNPNYVKQRRELVHDYRVGNNVTLPLVENYFDLNQWKKMAGILKG